MWPTLPSLNIIIIIIISDLCKDHTKMPSSSLAFMKNVILHFRQFPKSVLHFLISLLVEQQLIDGLGSGVSDAPGKSLQKHIRLEIVDELMKVVNRTSRTPAKFLNWSKKAELRRLAGLGYKKKWPMWIPLNLSPKP